MNKINEKVESYIDKEKVEGQNRTELRNSRNRCLATMTAGLRHTQYTGRGRSREDSTIIQNIDISTMIRPIWQHKPRIGYGYNTRKKEED